MLINERRVLHLGRQHISQLPVSSFDFEEHLLHPRRFGKEPRNTARLNRPAAFDDVRNFVCSNLGGATPIMKALGARQNAPA
jgi:hypothetical protein